MARNRMTFPKLLETIREHNTRKNITSQFEDKFPLRCGICFKASNWPDQEYSEKSRTYLFSSDNKYFLDSQIGNSLFANCEDGSDQGVRLDWYLPKWKVEYCFIEVS